MRVVFKEEEMDFPLDDDNDHYNYDDYMLSEDEDNALHSSEFEFESESNSGMEGDDKENGGTSFPEGDKESMMVQTCGSAIVSVPKQDEQGGRILSDDIRFHNFLQSARELFDRGKYFAVRELYASMRTELKNVCNETRHMDCDNDNNDDDDDDDFVGKRIVALDAKVLELWVEWLGSLYNDFASATTIDEIGVKMVNSYFTYDIASILRDIVKSFSGDTRRITEVETLLNDLTQFLILFRQYTLKNGGGAIPFLIDLQEDNLSKQFLHYLQRMVLFHGSFLTGLILKLQGSYVTIPDSISHTYDILLMQQEVTNTWSNALKLVLQEPGIATGELLPFSFTLRHNGSSFDVSLKDVSRNLLARVPSSRSSTSSLLMAKFNLLLQVFIFNFFKVCDPTRKDDGDYITSASLVQYGVLFDSLSKLEQTSISFQQNSELTFLLHFCRAIYYLPRTGNHSSYPSNLFRDQYTPVRPLIPYLDTIELCRTEQLAALQRLEEIGWYEDRGTTTASHSELKLYHKFLLLSFILTSMVLAKMNKLDIDPFEFEPLKVIEALPFIESLKTIYSKFVDSDFGSAYGMLLGPQFSKLVVPYLDGLVDSIVHLSQELKLWTDIAPKYTNIAISDVAKMLSFTDQIPCVTRDDIINLLMRSILRGHNKDLPEFKVDLTRDEIYFGDANVVSGTELPPLYRLEGSISGEANVEYLSDVGLSKLHPIFPSYGSLNGSLCSERDDRDLAVFFAELKRLREQRTVSCVNTYDDEHRDPNRNRNRNENKYGSQNNSLRNHDQPHFSTKVVLGDLVRKGSSEETDTIRSSGESEKRLNVGRDDEGTKGRAHLGSSSRHVLLAQKYMQLAHLVSARLTGSREGREGS